MMAGHVPVRIVVQARTSSHRLYGKVLLPIAGLQLAVLCAKRAATTGREVVLATSAETSDDALATAAEAHGVRVVRGPLEDVRSRFLMACADLPDEARIVRLTADNPLPDGAFIEILLGKAADATDYVGTSSPGNGLPYGLSAEAFRLGALRADPDESTAAREHVTMGLRLRPQSLILGHDDLGLVDLSHLRATVDASDDYERVARLFGDGEDPVRVPWATLVERLQRATPFAQRSIATRATPTGLHGEMVLGTAQFGIRYGATNWAGLPPEEEVHAILNRFVDAGGTMLDTARSYGVAEARIGRWRRGSLRDRVSVVTKLAPLDYLGSGSSPTEVGDAVRASVYQSCRDLCVDRLGTLLLHRAEQHDGPVWNELQALQAAGLIGRLGVSVYEVGQLLDVLQDPDVSHVQLPFNLLDLRWLEDNVQQALAKRPDVVVHVRSLLLQGLLAGTAEAWPERGRFDPTIWIERLESAARACRRSSRADLALAFGRSQGWIQGLVVGMETRTQLSENLASFASSTLGDEDRDRLAQQFADAPEWLLDPSRWKS